jgi:AcrR family transcriptional regulator
VPSRKSTPASRRAPRKLAPGYRLPPDQVAANQRERLLTAIIDLAHERGYDAITVTDVLDRAAVSRASFYQLFDNREHCVLAAYDVQVARTQAEIVSAYRNPGLHGLARLDAALTCLFGIVVAWPAAARLCTSEIATVGISGLMRRDRTTATSAAALCRALHDGTGNSPSPTVAKAIVGGIYHLIYSLVRDSRDGELLDMVTQVTGWMQSYQAAPSNRDPDPPSYLPQSVGMPSTHAPARTPTGENEDSDLRDLALRENIVNAVARLVADNGYQAMTYRDIAAAAQISLTTFYKHFANKQDAFLAVFDTICEHFAELVDRVFHTASDAPLAVRESLTTVLRHVAADPAASRLALVEIYLAGRPGIQRVDRIFQRLQDGLASSFETGPYTPPIAWTLVVGAMNEILHHSAIEDQLVDLPQLAPQLIYVALTPLIGSDQALEVAYEPAPEL